MKVGRGPNWGCSANGKKNDEGTLYFWESHFWMWESLTSLSLLISCKLSFPIVDLKMSSIFPSALKSSSKFVFTVCILLCHKHMVSSGVLQLNKKWFYNQSVFHRSTFIFYRYMFRYSWEHHQIVLYNVRVPDHFWKPAVPCYATEDAVHIVNWFIYNPNHT
jgi:hypothetical protein